MAADRDESIYCYGDHQNSAANAAVPILLTL